MYRENAGRSLAPRRASAASPVPVRLGSVAHFRVVPRHGPSRPRTSARNESRMPSHRAAAIGRSARRASLPPTAAAAAASVRWDRSPRAPARVGVGVGRVVFVAVGIGEAGWETQVGLSAHPDIITMRLASLPVQ